MARVLVNIANVCNHGVVLELERRVVLTSTFGISNDLSGLDSLVKRLPSDAEDFTGGFRVKQFVGVLDVFK